MTKHPARKSRLSEGPTPGFIQQRVLPLMEVIVALKDGDLLQVSVMTMDDDPIAERLWTRVRDSVRE